MPLEALELFDGKDYTALHVAAWAGNTTAAKVLVRKHPELLYIYSPRHHRLPIHVAARHGRKDTLSYLLNVTKDDHPVCKPYQEQSGIWLLMYAITSEFYDVALNLIHRNPKLATSEIQIGDKKKTSKSEPGDNKAKKETSGDNTAAKKAPSFQDPRSPLANLAAHVSAFPRRSRLYSLPPIKNIREKKQKHYHALQLAKCLCKEIQSLNGSNDYESFAKDPLFTAAKLGVHEVVEEIVDLFPSLVWARDSDNCSIFHHAIVQRHENVFNLLYQMSEHKKMITSFRDNNENTTLHLAGKLAPPNKLNLVPGAALQMQRELQWFEEVKKFVIPYYMIWRNKDNETAEMVFTEAHKELVVEGEKWMKGIANSCTIAATLIATIAFAAAISVPGGNNDANGLPILSNDQAFFVFAISNAFSLFTSITSLVMFFSILTSNYAEKDFLFALPTMLIIGLVTLFLSITAMMIAFGSIVYLLFDYNKRRVLITTGVFTIIPILSFGCLEFPLLLDLITSTYGGGIFGKKSNRLFY
ncbi:ankyrin repeat family protein [Actinidia rufa]|uniref:Ankyrin repeat family protein n=1 Tax=Actinidia rufa TaxID=165716 RepID=A0A7J0DEW5_9ERIC|nr:ankyrin repeat family protein [Actinidia rufa]